MATQLIFKDTTNTVKPAFSNQQKTRPPLDEALSAIELGNHISPGLRPLKVNIVSMPRTGAYHSFAPIATSPSPSISQPSISPAPSSDRLSPLVIEGIFIPLQPQLTDEQITDLKELDEQSKKILDEISKVHSIAKYYQNISYDQLYKLYIDASRWEKADGYLKALEFDRKEPGYMKAMLSAFHWLMIDPNNLNLNFLTPAFIEKLHDIAVSEVKSGSDILDQNFRNKDENNEEVAFHLVENGEDSTVSSKGIQELRAKKREYQVSSHDADDTNSYFIFGDFVKLIDSQKPKIEMGSSSRDKRKTPLSMDKTGSTSAKIPKKITVASLPRNIIIQCVQKFIDIYKNQITTTTDKLAEIIRFIQNLDQFHPFYDGNIRTFAILLLNKLLMDNGLSPTCLRDPNCFDCLSIDEIKMKVIEGQVLFQQLKY